MLSDGVVTLRPFTIEDADEHLEGEDAEYAKWLTGGKSTLKSVQDWIKRNEKHWQNDGPVFAFAIVVADDERLAGMIEANTDCENVDGCLPGDANISYALYPHARHKGYVRRSLAMIEDFLRSRGIKRAIIRVNPENVSSVKVPLKSLYVKVGNVASKKEKLVVFAKNL